MFDFVMLQSGCDLQLLFRLGLAPQAGKRETKIIVSLTHGAVSNDSLLQKKYRFGVMLLLKGNFSQCGQGGSVRWLPIKHLAEVLGCGFKLS